MNKDTRDKLRRELMQVMESAAESLISTLLPYVKDEEQPEYPKYWRRVFSSGETYWYKIIDEDNFSRVWDVEEDFEIAMFNSTNFMNPDGYTEITEQEFYAAYDRVEAKLRNS